MRCQLQLMMATISKWRAMWMVVMFDLPVKTKQQKTRYRWFHDFLLDDGFVMMQFSIYGRHCASREKAETHASRVRSRTPVQGEVRILQVTEAQFERMQIFRNSSRKPSERVPQQLELW